MRRQNELCFELLRCALPVASANENGSCGSDGVISGPLVQLPSSESAGVFRMNRISYPILSYRIVSRCSVAAISALLECSAAAAYRHPSMLPANYVDAEEPVDGAASGTVADIASPTSGAQKLLPPAQRRSKASRAARGARRLDDIAATSTDATSSSSNLLQLSASDAADASEASQFDSSAGANVVLQPPATVSNAFIVQANAGSTAHPAGDSATNSLRSLDENK